MAEIIYSGIIASEGLAEGPISKFIEHKNQPRETGTKDEENQALHHAIADSIRGLEHIIENQDQMAAEILDFQLALLEDDDMLTPAFTAISEGSAAHEAWSIMMQAEILEYQSMDDEKLAARAEDLQDLKARVLSNLFDSADAVSQADPNNGIVVAKEITPSQFIDLSSKGCAGMVTGEGSPGSHVSILARSRGIPLLVQCHGELSRLTAGSNLLLDAVNGKVIVDPNPQSLEQFDIKRKRQIANKNIAVSRAGEPAITADGQTVQILINIDTESQLKDAPLEWCDGIGLTRTEFLFHGDQLPDEQTQFREYAKILEWANGKSVTIRTLDAGGDKPIPGLTPEKEVNPFLGLRGLRLSLTRPDVFRVQLRALARVAAMGPIRVMAPMVTIPAEMEQFKNFFNTVIAELQQEDVRCSLPPLGMMIEVPAAALMADTFEADFYSIGSNDLIQYTMAAARDNAELSNLTAPPNPAVIELISRTVEAGARRNVDVSICGDMASSVNQINSLLNTGLRTLSVAPALTPQIKQTVRKWSTNK